MTREEFEKIVEEEFPNAIPEKFRGKIRNVAFLIEDEPSEAVRAKEALGPHETLLGYYQGIPNTVRGDYYGVGNTMPDTITLYQVPIENESFELMNVAQGDDPNMGNFQQEIIRAKQGEGFFKVVRKVVRDTMWHEIAHYFGMDEHEVRSREKQRRIS